MGFLFFALHPPLLPHPAAPPALTPPEPPHHSTPQHSSQHSSSHQLITPTYHTASHIQLLRSLSQRLITQHLALTTHGSHTNSSHTSRIQSSNSSQLSHHLKSQHSSQHNSSHHLWSPRGRGWLWRGRRSTQSLLAELLRTCAAAGCRLAGAVHRASWRSCCARGRRWAAAGCGVAGAVHRASCITGARVVAAGPRLAVVWQAQYAEPPG